MDIWREGTVEHGLHGMWESKVPDGYIMETTTTNLKGTDTVSTLMSVFICVLLSPKRGLKCCRRVALRRGQRCVLCYLGSGVVVEYIAHANLEGADKFGAVVHP